MNVVRLIGTTAVVMVLWGAVGCGTPRPAPAPTAAPPPPTSVAPTKSPFPPRPAELRLDGVDPCKLLTPAQLKQLAVGEPDAGSNDGNVDCIWSGYKPNNLWLVRTILTRGADYAMRNTAAVKVVQIGGFSAVATSAPLQDANDHCILSIDVAQGQNLWVQYGNTMGDYPGINHEVACQLDIKAAELMIKNLRALTNK